MNTTPRQLDFFMHLLLIFVLVTIIIVNQPMGLYLTLIAQFFVGIYQVLNSVTRTIRYYSFDRTIQKMIILYWIVVAIYGIGWITIYYMQADIEVLMPYLYGAWLIAFYYCYITYCLGFPKYIKSHLDI